MEVSNSFPNVIYQKAASYCGGNIPLWLFVVGGQLLLKPQRWLLKPVLHHLVYLRPAAWPHKKKKNQISKSYEEILRLVFVNADMCNKSSHAIPRNNQNLRHFVVSRLCGGSLHQISTLEVCCLAPFVILLLITTTFPLVNMKSRGTTGYALQWQLRKNKYSESFSRKTL